MNAMKRQIIKTGNLFLVIGLLFISLNGSSQDVKMTKQERKEARKNRQYLNFQMLDSILENKYFILTADYLENGWGNKKPVLSDLNFIKVESKNAVLQTGSATAMGLNGVGGVTAEGSISNLKIDKNLKNLTFNLRFSVVTDIGIYDVAMTISSDRNARATITGLSRGELIYDGHIKSLVNSHFYKGHNSI